MSESPNDVLFEFQRIGNIMRVTAVHAGTGREVVIQGPATLSRQLLQKNALRKLLYVMEKERKAQEN